MPLVNIFFWAFFASYVLHILDETLLNGGFVQWIKDNFWPTYHVRIFFWLRVWVLTLIRQRLGTRKLNRALPPKADIAELELL